jgi:uncharacterized tellurite resistance protein B-like protein
MFNKVKEYFAGETTLLVDSKGEPTSEDILVAAGVLLLEMAGSDKDYAPEEVRSIYAALEKEFGVSNSEALKILEKADYLRNNTKKIDDFVSTLNSSFSTKQRVRLLALVWKLILADGSVDKYEQRFATQIKFRLQLSDDNVTEAKEMVSTGKV